MALLEEAEADVREGRARSLDDVLAEAGRRANASPSAGGEPLALHRYTALLEIVLPPSAEVQDLAFEKYEISSRTRSTPPSDSGKRKSLDR